LKVNYILGMAKLKGKVKILLDIDKVLSCHEIRGLEHLPHHEAEASSEPTAKLEYLVDMVGELVIAQSMLKHNPDLAQIKTPRLQRDVAQLARVTAEVQKTAMAMRMVPVGQLFRRMPRLVRDLARKSGKKVNLELAGEDVELDRTLVEELADPLVHRIRDSMDHGLEPPAERVAAGKPASGCVRLAASHQAGQIAIEIADDGGGLNREKILAKALANGLVAPNAQLSDHELFHLIFQAGFSTAERVTDVSGRGVGMDVVRKHVEKLRGRIEIESEPGRGTRFQLKLPLTLAIIDGLVVIVRGQRYIVPIFAIRELFKPSPENLFTVEGKGEMALVRERLLPVIRLDRKLHLDGASDGAAEGLMIVGESEGRNFCLLVDSLAGKQEVVIKSLGPAFEHVQGVSGGAILGDGRVGLILDIAALVQGRGARG
jgi:two-component system chemotaxis sensor kinase CheA